MSKGTIGALLKLSTFGHSHRLHCMLKDSSWKESQGTKADLAGATKDKLMTSMIHFLFASPTPNPKK